MAAGDLPSAPIAELLGMNVTEVEVGKVVIEMETSERMYNPMGYAFATTLADDELFTTVEIKLNFLKPIWKSKLRAIGQLIKKGSSVGLLECNVYDEKNSLVAHSTSTCMILKGNPSGSRKQTK